QADALGAELLQVPTAPEAYEARFEEMLGQLRARGFAGLVFGNLHLADVQAWFETRTARAGLAHVEPLWGWAPAEVVAQFLAAGFRAVVVSVMEDRVDRRWLGAPFDERFVAALAARPDVDVCGERGEYHTFVYDGPGFRAPVRFALGEPVRSEGYCIRPARRVGPVQLARTGGRRVHRRLRARLLARDGAPRLVRRPRRLTFRVEDGLELVADAHGDPSAPPVLLLHGGGQTRRAWGGTAAALAARGFHAV